MQIFCYWFEEDVIALYNYFKIEQKTDYEKKSNPVKNVQNLNNNVKGILCFCDIMTNKNQSTQLICWHGKYFSH